MRGRRLALSLPRRLLTDLSHLARGFPRATLVTRINVAALVEPRDQARIPWPVVFAMAYALVAAGSPPLRRVYVKLPWPHLYELPQSVGSIIVERDWPHDGDSSEKALFLGRLKAPDTATLPDLAARMLAHKTAPIDSITDFRRALAIARLPLPLRRLLIWLSLNIGRQVPNFMGTFAISALGSHGARSSNTIPVWSSFLNYGPNRARWGVDLPLGRPPCDRWRPGGPRHPSAGGRTEWPCVGRIARVGRRNLRRGLWHGQPAPSTSAVVSPAPAAALSGRATLCPPLGRPDLCQVSSQTQSRALFRPGGGGARATAWSNSRSSSATRRRIERSLGSAYSDFSPELAPSR
jgi:hypothetical protein